MSCLVTGGAGFIGSHVVRELLEMGNRVVVLDDLSGGFRDNVDARATFVHGNIVDQGLVNELFAREKFQYVFHLAAYAAEGLSHFIKHYNYENNLIGSINLINASVNHDVQCFVFTSSIAVYGQAQVPMHEDMVPTPEDSYGIAKYAVEQELSASKRMFDLPYIIFRPHNVYGEHQNIGDRYRNVVGIFMNQILQRKPLTVFGDGTQTRAFTYIRDIAPLIARSIHERGAYNEVFNIGADKPVSVNDLAEVVCRQFGVEICISHLKERSEAKHAYSDHTKVHRMFGYRPRYSLEEGVAAMAAWVHSVGSRESTKFENIEIRKNMPPSWLMQE
jgi:UDP-glucose 4-epimerase